MKSPEEFVAQEEARNIDSPEAVIHKPNPETEKPDPVNKKAAPVGKKPEPAKGPIIINLDR